MAGFQKYFLIEAAEWVLLLQAFAAAEQFNFVIPNSLASSRVGEESAVASLRQKSRFLASE
jgi:hypothetical protein